MTTEPNPNDDSGAAATGGMERRREPRLAPEGIKTVTVFEQITATVRDESRGGICLKLPASTEFEMGQHVPVDDSGTKLIGRVCWTTVDNFGAHRLLGLAWVD